MMKLPLFRELMTAWKELGVGFVRMDDLARELLRRPEAIPIHKLTMAEIDGRSGNVATQGTQA